METHQGSLESECAAPPHPTSLRWVMRVHRGVTGATWPGDSKRSALGPLLPLTWRCELASGQPSEHAAVGMVGVTAGEPAWKPVPLERGPSQASPAPVYVSLGEVIAGWGLGNMCTAIRLGGEGSFYQADPVLS